MKIYSQSDNYKLYSGNMLEMTDVIKPCSIDAIVTDPPYELNFMNKGWDNSGIAFQKETWEKCLQVLKPGGYLLAFGGSRTFHRIACAIEDAGFEIRDCIMWLYGCLSSDTEILTSTGWKNSDNISVGDLIYSLDLQKDVIVKNSCLHVFKYDYDGEMVNLKNQNTDQLLTPNHHCIVDDNIRTRVKGVTTYTSHDYWSYKDAWQIDSTSVKLPLASKYDGSLEIGNLFAELLGLVISEGSYYKDTNAILIGQSSVNAPYVKRIRYILGKLHIKYSEYSRERLYEDKIYTEYDFYIGKESLDVVNKIKELAPEKKLTWGLLELSLSNKESLLKGLCEGDGGKNEKTKFGFDAFYQNDLEQLEIFQVLLHMTNKQGFINLNKYCCCIYSNPTTELQGKHFKDRFVNYSGGYVWCIETEVGNFIARRNGKIFITGNSGFPKSMNIGLAIDKKNGVDNRTDNVIKGVGKSSSVTHEGGVYNQVYFERIAQNEWNGWGTTLKPSYEPIIVARKPCEGTCVDNVLKWGVGGLNIDECRIGTEQRSYKGMSTHKPEGAGCFRDDNWEPKDIDVTVNGRYPSNVILTYDEIDYNEVCGGFPNTVSSGGSGEASMTGGLTGNVYNGGWSHDVVADHLGGLGDSGSAARYFYCAKASKKDRDEGLENFEPQKGIRTNAPRKNEEIKTKPRINIHPTVKPTSLMQYLVRLVTPKGGVVLDPFNGSGSTGKAVMWENRDNNSNYSYVGTELDEKYLEISKVRIDHAKTTAYTVVDGKSITVETTSGNYSKKYGDCPSMFDD